MAEPRNAQSVAIRPARLEDRDFVLSTAARLAEFGPPPWRTVAEVVAGESRALRAFFEARPQDDALLIAEDPGGRPLGFAYLETQLDFFTRRPHAQRAAAPCSRPVRGGGDERGPDSGPPARLVDDEAGDFGRPRRLEDAGKADLQPARQPVGRGRDEERVVGMAREEPELPRGVRRRHRVAELGRQTRELGRVLRPGPADGERRRLSQGS